MLSPHLLACYKRIVAMADGNEKKTKMSEILTKLEDRLYPYLTSKESLPAGKIQELLEFIESIGSINFLHSKRKYFYEDLQQQGLWTLKQAPTKPALGVLCKPLSAETSELLKETHAALATMARYLIRNNELENDEVREWREHQLDTEESVTKHNDYIREVKVTRPVHHKLVPLKTKADVEVHLENFVDDFIKLNPNQKHLKSQYLNFLMKKGGQEMHSFFMYEFGQSYQIAGHPVKFGNQAVFYQSKINQEWLITDDGKMMCDIAMQVRAIGIDGSGEMWVLNSKNKMLQKLDPNTDEDVMANLDAEPLLIIVMHAECLADNALKNITLKVRDFEMTVAYAKNLIMKGHPDHDRTQDDSDDELSSSSELRV